MTIAFSPKWKDVNDDSILNLVVTHFTPAHGSIIKKGSWPSAFKWDVFCCCFFYWIILLLFIKCKITAKGASQRSAQSAVENLACGKKPGADPDSGGRPSALTIRGEKGNTKKMTRLRKKRDPDRSIRVTDRPGWLAVGASRHDVASCLKKGGETHCEFAFTWHTSSVRVRVFGDLCLMSKQCSQSTSVLTGFEAPLCLTNTVSNWDADSFLSERLWRCWHGVWKKNKNRKQCLQMWDLKEKTQRCLTCNFKAVHRCVSAVFPFERLSLVVAANRHWELINMRLSFPPIIQWRTQCCAALGSKYWGICCWLFQKKKKMEGRRIKKKKNTKHNVETNWLFTRFSLHPTHIFSQEQIPCFPTKQRARGKETRQINDVTGKVMQRHRHACGWNPILVGLAVKAVKM